MIVAPSAARPPWWKRLRLILPLALLFLLGSALPHLKMGPRWAVRILCLIPLIWSLRDLRWLSEKIVQLWPAVPHLLARIIWPEKWRWRWEQFLVSLLVAVAAVHFACMLRAMASATMDIDEIGTIQTYSSHGPATVLTNYGLAKNHVFFNLLNSVLPGRASLDPLRARMLSMLAMVAAWIALLYFGWKRRRFYEAGLAAGLIGLNQHLLKQNLEARGYGFTFALALVGGLALGVYLRQRDRRALGLLGLTVALGTFTVPSYLVFGGSLLVFLFLTVRRGEVFRTGLFTAGLIAALYSPILTQLFHVASGYDEAYGESYNSLKSVFGTLKYALPETLWKINEASFFAILAGIALIPLLLRGVLRQDWKTIQLLLAATAVFLTFCLVLRTPPARITAFLAAPLLLSLGIVVGAILRHPALRFGQPYAAAALFGGLILFGWKTDATFAFEVKSKISETSQITANLLPFGGEVWVSSHLHSIRGFLGKGIRVSDGKLPAEGFRAGHFLLIDEEKRPEIRALASRIPFVRQLSFGTKGRVLQEIWFLQPTASGLGKTTLDGRLLDPTLSDRDIASGPLFAAGSTHQLESLPEAGKPRSFNLWSETGWNGVKVEIHQSAPDGRERLIQKRDYLIEDKILSVDLQDVPAAKIRIVLRLDPVAPPLHLTEIFEINDPAGRD